MRAQTISIEPLSIAEDLERPTTELHLIEDHAPQTREINSDHDVWVLPAESEGVVARACGALALDDPLRLESSEVREHVALRAAELLRKRIHRERTIREVERGHDLPTEAGDAGETRRDLATDTLEEGLGGYGDGILGLGRRRSTHSVRAETITPRDGTERAR